MQYKCIRGVVTTKGPIAIGDTIELPDYEAKVLLAQGKLVPHHEEEIRTTAIEEVVKQTPKRGRKPRNGR
jgi:hypothetical protein